MTNEEYVEEIKTGRKDLIIELWDQIRPFVFKKAAERARNLRREFEIDDMMQEAFLIMPAAIDYFNKEKGSSFVSIFSSYFLPKAFAVALYGKRIRFDSCDPIHSARSLDEPFSSDPEDGDGLSLLDVLQDPEAETPFRKIEDDDNLRSIRRFLRAGIDQLPPQHRDLLYAVYHDGLSISAAYRQQICGDRSLARYGQIHREALKQLRTWVKGKGKIEAEHLGLYDIIGSTAYFGTYQNFRYTGCSSVERAALKREDFVSRCSRQITPG